jgi:hypothetical protein
LLAIPVSLAALGISWYQASQAKQQATVAEQEQLDTLVAEITQERATLASPSSISSDESLTYQDETELTQADEAVGLIDQLHGVGVTSIDYAEVAHGLELGGSYAQALAFYRDAARQNTDPQTEANILRFEAGILYEFGKNLQAEAAIRQAEAAYSGPWIASSSRRGNMTYTLLFDVPYQSHISCSKASRELERAKQLLAVDGGSASNNSLAAQDERTMTQRCSHVG